MKKKIQVLAITVGCLLWAGCQLVPTETNRNQAVKTAGEIVGSQASHVTKQLENTAPPMNIRASGDSKVDISVLPIKSESTANSEGTQDAAAKDSLFGGKSTSIPFGVKLCLIGAGIFAIAGAIFWVIRYVKRSSAAGAAALSLADTSIANLIHAKEAHVRVSTDPSVIASISSDLSFLEKARGQLNSK